MKIKVYTAREAEMNKRQARLAKELAENGGVPRYDTHQLEIIHGADQRSFSERFKTEQMPRTHTAKTMRNSRVVGRLVARGGKSYIQWEDRRFRNRFVTEVEINVNTLQTIQDWKDDLREGRQDG